MFRAIVRLALAGFAALAAVHAASAEEPRRGGVMTMVVQPEPPILVSAFNSAGPIGVVSTKMLEGLVTYDFEMNPQPALATAWEVAPDGREIVFHLREGVRWHDGTPFTAADVQFSIMEVLKALHPRGKSTFAAVTAVETPDEHTAVLKLSQPSPPLMRALASYESQILPRHIYAGTDIVGNPANSAPIGTGPFRFGEWRKGDYILLERNDDYWDQGKPYLDRIVLRIIPDATGRAAAFETGEVHAGGFSPVPLNDVQRLAERPFLAVETRGYEYFAPIFLMEFNLDNPYLGFRPVRQAIAHAIDREFIVEAVWFGFGKPATGPISSVQPWFYTDDVPQYRYDPAQAETLLDMAGFVRDPDGVRFRITHDFLPYGETYQRTAEYVRQALRQVGIEVDLRAQDVAGFLRRVYTERDFDMTNNFFYGMPDPTIGVQRIYWSDNIRPGVPFSNTSAYTNPQMDAVIEAAQTENDPEARTELFHELQRIAAEDLPVLDLFEMHFFTLYNTRVHNLVTGPDGVYGSFADTWMAE